MSTFGVFIETLATIDPHPNADRLEIGTLVDIGYEFILPKGAFKVGDRVIYFPEDAILPEVVLERIGLKGKLGGASKNRVKAIKIRGCVSQGVVSSLSSAFGPRADELDCDPIDYPSHAPAGSVDEFLDGQDGEKIDYSVTLGIEKYDPDVRQSGGPNGAPRVAENPLPAGVMKYDLENAERHKKAVEVLLSEALVYVTEKVEGANLTALLRADGTKAICSKNRNLVGDDFDQSIWARGAQNAGLWGELERLQRDFFPGKSIAFRGELVGPGDGRGNWYELPELTAKIFDIEVNGRSLDSTEFWTLLPANICVPLLHVGRLEDFLGGRSLREVCTGPSELLKTKLREGIVIKPMHEMSLRGLGRVALKQRSPEYLAIFPL